MEQVLIQTTVILMGKGIKPGTHQGGNYLWRVTPEALEKIDCQYTIIAWLCWSEQLQRYVSVPA